MMQINGQSRRIYEHGPLRHRKWKYEYGLYAKLKNLNMAPYDKNEKCEHGPPFEPENANVAPPLRRIMRMCPPPYVEHGRPSWLITEQSLSIIGKDIVTSRFAF